MRIESLRLECDDFWVSLRVASLEGSRWLASADTPDGPSLGCGDTRLAALTAALSPFDGRVDELLSSLPSGGLGASNG